MRQSAGEAYGTTQDTAILTKTSPIINYLSKKYKGS